MGVSKDSKKLGKVNGYTFRETTFVFILVSPSQWGSILKREKPCSSNSKILSFKIRPHFGRAALSREVDRKTRKLFPLVSMVEKHGGLPIHVMYR